MAGIPGGDQWLQFQAPGARLDIDVQLGHFDAHARERRHWQSCAWRRRGSFCMDEEKEGGRTHLSFKALVDNNPPKPKDLQMISARA